MASAPNGRRADEGVAEAPRIMKKSSCGATEVYILRRRSEPGISRGAGRRRGGGRRAGAGELRPRPEQRVFEGRGIAQRCFGELSFGST